MSSSVMGLPLAGQIGVLSRLGAVLERVAGRSFPSLPLKERTLLTGAAEGWRASCLMGVEALLGGCLTSVETVRSCDRVGRAEARLARC